LVPADVRVGSRNKEDERRRKEKEKEKECYKNNKKYVETEMRHDGTIKSAVRRSFF